MIINCMRESTWNERKHKDFWGERDIADYGFISCVTSEYFWKISHIFKNIEDELVMVFIDEDELLAKIKYEEDGDYDILFPHIYGLVNRSAVVAVMPLLKDKNGNWVKNIEFDKVAPIYRR